MILMWVVLENGDLLEEFNLFSVLREKVLTENYMDCDRLVNLEERGGFR